MTPTLTLDQAVAEAQSSEKFHAWGKPRLDDLKQSHIMAEKLRLEHLEQSCIMAEKHYTPDELAALWGVSAETVRTIFREEPGVLRITQPNEKKRKYVLTRIPHTVAERVHKRLSAVPQ
jgi:hypothetical protein